MTLNLNSLPTSIDLIHLVFASLILVLFILLLKNAKRNKTEAVSISVAPTKISEPHTEVKKAPAQTPALKEPTPDAALQLLTLLQQDARFIDFIKEDLSTYSDADIGAAARVVHEGSKKTLDTYFTLEAIRSETEETTVHLPKGFNASEVRITGNVVGEAPFEGVLIHKGWKVSSTKLPKVAEGHDTSIITPAEVEL
mgnify:CR=1 FL=1